MPNDCWNSITLTGTNEEVERFIAHEFKGVPEWALKIQTKGHEGLQFRLWSRKGPDLLWLEGLLVTYPSLWVKNLWEDEDGMAGVWIGSRSGGIRQFEWEDLCLEERCARFKPA